MTGMQSDEGTYEYLYDTESRLIAVREGGSLLMSVLYDGLDERVRVLRPADWQAMREVERQEQKWVQADEDTADDMPGQDSAHETVPNAAETPNEETVPAAAQDTGTNWHPFWYGFGQGMLNGFAIFNLPATVDLHRWFHEWWMENWQQPGTGITESTDGINGMQQNGTQGTGSAGTTSTEADPVRGIQRLITQSFAEQETYTLTGYDVVYYVNDLNRANSEVLTASTQEAEKAAQSPQAGTDDENYIYGIQRLYAEREESTETYLYNGRGSVVQLLRGGTVSQSYSYNAYGYINTDEYGIQAPFYGYNGEQYDPATGLQYLRARYYAPQNGSFTTQDSFAGLLTDALSQNGYTYAQNNPVTFADPSGHSIWDSIRDGFTNAVNAVTNTVTSVYNTVTGTTTRKVANTSSAATKKPYTATLTPGTFRRSTYTSGAANAAQIAKIPNASGKLASNTVKSVLSNSHRPLQGNDPDLIPDWITDISDIIKSFGRGICDANAKQLEAQLELEQAEMQSWRAIGKAFGQIYEKYSEFVYENEQRNNELTILALEKVFHTSISGIILWGADNAARKIVFQEVSDANYAANSKLDAEFGGEDVENKLVGPGIYINGQGLEPFSNYRFGDGSTFSAQGCLPIAIYNALIRLGDYESLADIQYGIETNYYTAIDDNGSVATYIPKYFSEKGYDVHLNLAPTPEELEWMAQEYDTVIITHYNTPSLFGGSHYMNLYYDSEANQYVANNWENRQSDPKILPNMDKLYGEGFNRVYYAYGISKGEE